MFSDFFVVWRRASQADGTLRDGVCCVCLKTALYYNMEVAYS